MKPKAKEAPKEAQTVRQAEAVGKSASTGNERPAGEASEGAPESPKAETNFTSASVASLLQSEFAGELEAAENEVPAAEVDNHESNSEDETSEGTQETESEEQAEPEEQAQSDEVPEALTQAIEQWEANGGGELPPALQTLVEKRIGKLTAQRETERQAKEAAEERVRQLEAEAEEQRANGNPAPSQGHMDEKTLTRVEQAASRLVQDAENYLDDTANDDERARVERYMEAERLDAKGLKRRVRELNTFLSQEAPRQRQAISSFREQESKLEPQAKEFFPFLWDKSSPEYQQAQEVLKIMPDLVNRTPAHKFALGVYVLGLKEFEKIKAAKAGKANGTTNGKATVKAPVKAPVASAAAPASAGRVNGRSQQEQALRQRFERNPTRESVAELLRAELRS